MAIGMDLKCGIFDYQCDRNQRSLPHLEIFIKQHTCQHVKVITIYVTNRRKLAGFITSMKTPSFYLITGTIRARGIIPSF